MREIKFKYIYKNKYGYLEGEQEFITEIKTIDEIENTEFEILNLEREHLELIARSQYTGLKDKNGKEIFEGDIVEIENQKYVVKFKDGSFVGEHTKTKTSPVLYILMTYPIPLQNRCKVLGNIYENSGLLN